MGKHTVEKLLFVIKFVPGQYNAHQMCNEVILENLGMLIFTPNCWKNRKICDNVDNYAHPLGSFPDCYETQKCVIKLFNNV